MAIARDFDRRAGGRVRRGSPCPFDFGPHRMSASDRDPLSSEERELAARLQRLGGPDGPSAALDARILAAARQAVGQPAASRTRRRPRFAAWLPGSAITAVGTAAALVIVIGTAWQLRPVDRPAAQPPGIADDEAVTVELLAPRKTPAASETAAEAPTAAASPSTRASAAAPHGSTAEAVADRRAAAQDAAAPTAETDSGSTGTATPVAAEPAPTSAPHAGASTPSPAPAAPVLDTVGPSADAPATPQQAEASSRPRRATYTTAARARAESRDGPRGASTPAKPDDVHAVDLASIPVHEDASLPPGEWLERIRARRDTGDVDAARTSLERFIRAHPRLRPPRDLRELAR
jgi:hypothetical protein